MSPLSELTAWYRGVARDLPWRRTRDPYAIWISETMLQQTTVAAVVPYFERWMARFPSVQSLANAPEAEVLSLWQGLGYYSRARNLQRGAVIIARDGWPASAAEWRRIPGVGPYTAAAIASIALGEPVAVVDGNVERVFARFTACRLTGSALKKAAQSWADGVLDRESSGDWNQAVMELGATVCRPVNPGCPECPIGTKCEASRRAITGELPVRPPKPERIKVRRDVGLFLRGGEIGLRRAIAGEWWHGLWILPEVPPVPGTAIAEVKTVVTRHDVTLMVWPGHEPLPPGCDWLAIANLDQTPIPAPFRRALRLLGIGDREISL